MFPILVPLCGELAAGIGVDGILLVAMVVIGGTIAGYIAMSGSLGDGMTRNSLASLECSPVGLRESLTICIDKFYKINTDLDILLYEK